MNKFVLKFILALIICSMLVAIPNIETVTASETLYIRADGSVEGTDKIQRQGNVYTFTGNINGPLRVERDNIVLDGEDYTLQGSGYLTGISLLARNNVTVRNVVIQGFLCGIDLFDSKHCALSRNNVTSNKQYGINIWESKYNSIVGNIVRNGSHYGISLAFESSDNVLKNNSMIDNKYNFDVECDSLEFVNDVDASNTVDGKPIYYWVNERDKTVPSDAGYVALINCINITVENFVFSKNAQGILLFYTTNSIITENTITSYDNGIQLSFSSNNNISGNIITSERAGISLQDSSYNTINKNSLTHNVVGIKLDRSSNNVLRDNRMEDNEWNFKVEGGGFVNDVDASNTVDGKPICYWVNERDKTVPYDAGYVCLVNCTRITVQNLNLADIPQGILLAYTTNSTIAQNQITNNTFGIILNESSKISITKNYITNNHYGISSYGSPSNVVTENVIEENSYGITVSNCSNSIISENNIIANGHGVDLGNSSNTIVTGNIVDENGRGIGVSNCSNSIISENNVTTNTLFGIQLYLSSNNTVNENNLTHNNVGIELYSSPNNVLRDNSMDNNVVNFEVVPKLGSHLNSVNDVDTSNTVDGKPIYYWVNQKDRTVPSDAGCIVLVNCTNITVKNLNLTNNGEGILLVFTTNSTITKNNITNNSHGIYLRWSSNNSIHGNSITNNNGFVIYLHDSSDNIFYNNTFINNELGVEDSSFWNFWVTPSVNIWDDGHPSGGNYWDSYDGVDNNGDGIGDTPYVIDENNQDNYPLMNPWVPLTQQSEPFPITWIIVAIAIIYIVGGTAALRVYFIEVKK
ncbi:hypothetical protein D4R42_03845 [bacterium]|nr:MAG: hypothetical protein D4R42_03845 [bacterium]